MINKKEIEFETESLDKDKDSDKTIDNEFEALSETKRVYSNTPLNSDHVLANLNDAEKELITETIFNCNYAKDILKRYSLTRCIPKWDNKIHNWIRNDDGSVKYFTLRDIDKDGAKQCENNAEKIFNMFMLKINSIAVLTRNNDKNFILSKGFYKDRTEEQVVYGQDDRNMMEKIKDKLSGESEYEEY